MEWGLVQTASGLNGFKQRGKVVEQQRFASIAKQERVTRLTQTDF